MKEAMLSDGGERKQKPRDVFYYIREIDGIQFEHFDEPREINKTKATTLEMFDNTPLANWFRENKIVGVL